MPLRLVHFADLHFGVDRYGHLDASTGLHSRLQDLTRSLSFVFDTALAEGADLVICAGDVYRTPSPDPTTQREFANQLRRLCDAAIPVVFVVGNHDAPATHGRASSIDVFAALALDGIHVLSTPQLLRLETRSGPLQIAGLPWPTRHYLRAHEEYRDLDHASLDRAIQQICEARIAQFAAELEPRIPAVLAAHITAAEAAYSGSERTSVIGSDPVLMTSALAHPGFDYVALGHIHCHQNLNPDGHPPVVYAGSVECMDFGEAGDVKGFCLVELPDRGGTGPVPPARYRFVPTPARRFVSVDLTQRDLAVGADLTETLVRALGSTDLEGAVVRVTYPVGEDGLARLDMGRLRAALRPAHHVAGLVPKAPPRVLPRRAGASENMSVAEALDRYIDNDPGLAPERATLQRAAAGLKAELDTGDAAAEEAR